MTIAAALWLLASLAPLAAAAPAFDLGVLSRDLALAQAQGAQYFNQTNCIIPSDLTQVPQLPLNTADDLLQLWSLRSAFPANQLVYAQLTAADDAATGTPAYLLPGSTPFVVNVSCTYLRGLGFDQTSVLVDYTGVPIANTTYATHIASPATDLLVADLTLDRTNSSWRAIVEPCAFALNYPTLVSGSLNATQLLATQTCVDFVLAMKSGGDRSVVQTVSNSAIYMRDVQRTHVLRVRSWGGFIAYGGVNWTLSSSVFDSLAGAVISNLSPLSNSQQEAKYLSSGIIIFNNTVRAPYGDCFNFSPFDLWLHHNQGTDCGGSAIVLDRAGSALIEYNRFENFTVSPSNPGMGGSGGVYAYGGWQIWGGITIRYNWFYTAAFGTRCWYFDDMTSFITWEGNTCFQTMSMELNNGRFNIFRNNLVLSLDRSGTLPAMGTLNCRSMDYGNLMTPYNWLSCAAVLAGNHTGGIFSALPRTAWANRASNGTITGPMTSIQQVVLSLNPELDYDVFCAPTTAGPLNMSCAVPGESVYVSNNVSYPFPCELLPSNNRLGSTDYVGFTVIYNSTQMPTNFSAGFGCGPCDQSHTSGCNTNIAPGFDYWVYDARKEAVGTNWFNISWYNYNAQSPLQLLGTNLTAITASGGRIAPQDIVISPNSMLGIENPGLLSVPFAQIGLLAPVSDIVSNGTKSSSSASSLSIASGHGVSTMLSAAIAAAFVSFALLLRG